MGWIGTGFTVISIGTLVAILWFEVREVVRRRRDR